MHGNDTRESSCGGRKSSKLNDGQVEVVTVALAEVRRRPDSIHMVRHSEGSIFNVFLMRSGSIVVGFKVSRMCCENCTG